MDAAIMLIMAVYAVIGGLSPLYLFFSMPAVFAWKCYRKAKYHIALSN